VFDNLFPRTYLTVRHAAESLNPRVRFIKKRNTQSTQVASKRWI
jgi:hypothetical protein